MLWLPFSLLNALFESIANVFGKHGAQKINVLSAVWAQRFFSLFILLPLVLLTGSLRPTPSIFWIILVFNCALGTFTSILFFKALKDSPLSLTLPITAFTPAFLLVMSPIITKEFPSAFGVVGTLMIVFGSYMLNLSKRVHGFFAPITSIVKEDGTREMFLVALLWSVTVSFDKIAIRNSNPMMYSFLLGTLSVIYLSIILLVRQISIRNVIRNFRILAPIGILAGFSVALHMQAISMTVVSNAIAVKRTSSLFGAIWGKLFFKETQLKERFTGAVIMVIGVALITIGS